MKLILGSSSKHRKEILEKAGYVFDIFNPDIDEKLIETNNSYERPLILARAKADDLMKKIKEPALIIALDTVVIGNGKLYEKPKTEIEAREFLKKYSEDLVPETVSAIVVINTITGKRYEGVDKAKVFFKKFPPFMIEDFIKNGEPLSRAGGFGIQHPIMEPYVEKIEGDKGSVTGTPLQLLKKLLTEAGYQ
ncbi:MAG: Maf family protein [Candidatus Paceibacterota bacterium]|jgi:septum formation protein